MYVVYLVLFMFSSTAGFQDEGHLLLDDRAMTADLFPLKATAKLISCEAIEPASGVTACASHVHRIIFSREVISLVADVDIPAAYPLGPPIFHLKFTGLPSNTSAPAEVDNNLKV